HSVIASLPCSSKSQSHNRTSLNCLPFASPLPRSSRRYTIRQSPELRPFLAMRHRHAATKWSILRQRSCPIQQLLHQQQHKDDGTMIDHTQIATRNLASGHTQYKQNTQHGIDHHRTRQQTEQRKGQPREESPRSSRSKRREAAAATTGNEMRRVGEQEFKWRSG